MLLKTFSVFCLLVVVLDVERSGASSNGFEILNNPGLTLTATTNGKFDKHSLEMYSKKDQQFAPLAHLGNADLFEKDKLEAKHILSVTRGHTTKRSTGHQPEQDSKFTSSMTDKPRSVLDHSNIVTEISVQETFNGYTIKRKPTQEELKETQSKLMTNNEINIDDYLTQDDDSNLGNKYNSEQPTENLEDVAAIFLKSESPDDVLDDMEVILGDTNDDFVKDDEDNDDFDKISKLINKQSRKFYHTQTQNFSDVKEFNVTISEREGDLFDDDVDSAIGNESIASQHHKDKDIIEVKSFIGIKPKDDYTDKILENNKTVDDNEENSKKITELDEDNKILGNIEKTGKGVTKPGNFEFLTVNETDDKERTEDFTTTLPYTITTTKDFLEATASTEPLSTLQNFEENATQESVSVELISTPISDVEIDYTGLLTKLSSSEKVTTASAEPTTLVFFAEKELDSKGLQNKTTTFDKVIINLVDTSSAESPISQESTAQSVDNNDISIESSTISTQTDFAIEPLEVATSSIESSELTSLTHADLETEKLDLTISSTKSIFPEASATDYITLSTTESPTVSTQADLSIHLSSTEAETLKPLNENESASTESTLSTQTAFTTEALTSTESVISANKENDDLDVESTALTTDPKESDVTISQDISTVQILESTTSSTKDPTTIAFLEEPTISTSLKLVKKIDDSNEPSPAEVASLFNKHLEAIEEYDDDLEEYPQGEIGKVANGFDEFLEKAKPTGKVEMEHILRVKVLNSSAEFSIKIGRKDETFYVPTTAHITEYQNIINLTWRSSGGRNSSVALRVFEKADMGFFIIKEIITNLMWKDEFVTLRKPVAISPDPTLDDTMPGRTRMVMMKDGTYITFSNVEFLKKVDPVSNARENLDLTSTQPKLWHFEIASICLVSLIIIAIVLYVIATRSRKGKITLGEKDELQQVTHC